MVIITYIYTANERTKKTINSLQSHGYEVAIINNPRQGNGYILKQLYDCYQRAATGHETFFYVDAADSFCQKFVEPPKDHILYSTEKACYPHPEIATQYKPTKGPWKYLNGGGYGGPIPLIIEFFDKYELTKHADGVNGQHEQMMAFLKAEADGFPIKLDTKCKIFQTLAFTNNGELKVDNGLVKNTVTKTTPAFLHGNGLTDMEWIYKLSK